MRLTDVSVTWRLALALAIPLLALAGLAYVEINTTFSAYQHARHLGVVSADLGVMGDFVHALQAERAEAVGLLASKGAEHRDQLNQAREKASPALQKMDQVLADMKAEGDPTLLRHEEELAALLARLPEIRTGTDGVKLSPSDAFVYYTDLVHRLMNVSREFSLAAGARGVVGKMMAYNLLMNAK